MKLLVDHALRPETGSQLPPMIARIREGASPAGLVVAAAIATLALFAVNSMLSVGLALMWANAGKRMVYDVAADLFRLLQRVSLLVHSRRSVGDLLTRLTADTWGVYTVTEALLIGPVGNLFTLATVGVVRGGSTRRSRFSR